jgi:hypothetical protein
MNVRRFCPSAPQKWPWTSFGPFRRWWVAPGPMAAVAAPSIVWPGGGLGWAYGEGAVSAAFAYSASFSTRSNGTEWLHHANRSPLMGVGLSRLLA